MDTVAGSGRRGTTVRLARGAGLVAGVDFGHSHVMVAVGDMAGPVLAEARRPIDPGHDWRGGLDRAGDCWTGCSRASSTPSSATSASACPPRSPTAWSARPRSCPAGWGSTRGAACRKRSGARPDRQRRQPRRPRRAPARRRPGSRGMVFVKVSSGIGADSSSTTRCSGAAPGRRRDRPPDPRRPGAALPVREPWLPGGLRLLAGRCRHDVRQLPGAGIDDLVRGGPTRATWRHIARLRGRRATSAGAWPHHEPHEPRPRGGRRRHGPGR